MTLFVKQLMSGQLSSREAETTDQGGSEPPKPKSGTDTARAHLAPKNPDKIGTFLRGLDGRAWRLEEGGVWTAEHGA